MLYNIILSLITILSCVYTIVAQRSIRKYIDNTYILEVLPQGIRAFGTEKKFRKWLYGNIRAVDNRRPIKALRDGDKTAILHMLELIEQHKYL
jgi:hypothetical protein